MKILSCSEAVSRMFEFLEGIVTPEQKKELDNHVEECRHCCDRFEFEQLFKEKLVAVASQDKAPEKLVKRVGKLLKELF
ncbi:MAG: hypothetical protein UV59_C0017G0005 [Candidatus Gottesmanbacteria bacterium GW2011_GWA1_43_11]|uniref:Putative zinc-finger domain-containing protein n=1 Tax=Candidatus Gottesmanbacteria bacterium GW2011_GWA1_43_11 TaxID=1618436 RepID=A0A0G1CG91_9BACT|nr:MAG: hypothetical protein UV59_C0017G0005 [Candidatus Gottesmanbacteria bacterium GW2011_GWA1_43_11]